MGMSSRSTVISSGYTPEATSFFSYLPTQPSSAVKNAYNGAWANFPTVMSLHDRLWVNFSEYEDNSFVSLPNPSSTIKSKISTPEFRKFMGWTGGAGKALNTNFTAGTHANLFTRNSGCVWFYSNIKATGLKIAIGGTDAFEANGCEIYPNFSGTVYGACNGGAVGKSITSTIGLISVVRVNSTTIEIFKNGVSLGTGTDASSILASNSIYELASNINGVLSFPWDGEVSACGIASGSVNQLDLFNMIEQMKGNMPLWSFYGDSITANFGITWEQGWAYKLTQSLGDFYPYNKAVSGKTIQDFLDSGCPIRPKGTAGQMIFFGWGVNDCAVAAGTAAYKANYRIVLNDAISKGWSVDDMVITKKWYITDVPTYALYHAYVIAAQEIATEYGIANVFNLYELAYGLSDQLHPSAAGSTTISDFFYYSLKGLKTAWTNPTTAVNNNGSGYQPWVSPSNVLTLNGTYAEYDFYDAEVSYILDCAFPNFNIPNGATIRGFEVRVSMLDLANSLEAAPVSIEITKNGVVTGTNFTTYEVVNGVQRYYYFGGGNLFGASLTPSDCANLGVYFQVSESAGDAQLRVDNIQLRIIYTL